jgi:hypothetical protein
VRRPSTWGESLAEYARKHGVDLDGLTNAAAAVATHDNPRGGTSWTTEDIAEHVQDELDGPDPEPPEVIVAYRRSEAQPPQSGQSTGH